MNRILIFDTALGTSNQGDEIILKSCLDGLSPILSEAMTFRLATHIENYSSLQMLYPGKQLTQIAFDVDYKFICGTNLIMSNLKHIRPQFWVNLFNSKIYNNSVLVGVGRDSDFEVFDNFYTKKLYSRILSRDFIHSVRDNETKEVIESLGFKAINTGCPTLWSFDKEKCKRIPKTKGNNVVFSVSGYINQQDPYSDGQMIDCLLDNYETCYAWIQTTADEKYLNSLINIKESRIIPIYSLSKFSKVLDGSCDYVGTRLHGGIFALQHDARSIIISIDERADGFSSSNNIPILKRENISFLDNYVNSSFNTEINVNRSAINEFISQFI